MSMASLHYSLYDDLWTYYGPVKQLAPLHLAGHKRMRGETAWKAENIALD